MRSFLLAAAAATALTAYHSACAQTPGTPSDNRAPPSGAAAGSPAAAAPVASAAPTISPGRAAWVGPPFTAVPGPTNVPGTVQVYLRGLLTSVVALPSDSYNTAGGNKQAPYTFGNYARLYPSMTGTTANGLKYGAYLEIRQNSGGAGNSGNTGGNTLLFRREVGYVGGNWGTVRFGQADQPPSLFMTGTFENFGDNWNDDMPKYNNAQTVPLWLFPESSGDYGMLSVMYLSPRIAGFDAGVSFAPSNVTSGEPACTASATAIATPNNCARLTSFPGSASSATLSTLQRVRNVATAVGRYTGSFGPVGLVATAGFIGASNVESNAVPGLPTSFATPAMFDGGLQVTYGGFAVGGHVDAGQVNGNGSTAINPVQKGGHDELTFIVGTSYAFGPFIVGASYLVNTYQGAVDTPILYGTGPAFGLRRETALEVGGTYAWAPGATVSLNYGYGQRHQANYNFLSDTRGVANNNTRASNVTLVNKLVF